MFGLEKLDNSAPAPWLGTRTSLTKRRAVPRLYKAQPETRIQIPSPLKSPTQHHRAYSDPLSPLTFLPIMGSPKKTMSSGGGGHSSTALSLSSLNPSSAHMQAALKSIWEAIAPKGTLTREEFTTFLRDVQKETDPADVAAILGSVLPSGSSGNKVGMAEFFRYMCSPAANALRLSKQSEKDTSHQLTSYFISSSHNTYLVGHQLYGDSTTAGYINVLRRGCRCIEIDVWDGDDGEPEVFHGWTLTKEISFVDVCKAIRDHAFWEEGGEKVDGPVVISLECHCSAAQQEKMVQIMKTIWKGILVDAPLCGAKSVHEVDKVPTLEQLRGKILVKTKYYPLEALANAATQGVARMSLDTQQRQQQAPPRRAKTSPNTKDTSSEDSSSDEELSELARESGHKKPKKVKITRALSDLAIYIGATHFPGTFNPATPLRPTTVFSFSEKVFASHYATWPRELFHHNLRHFMRVYPFGLRFSSSNADPTQFWRRGVQLVALNWQKADEGMMLNEGMFAGEGGYVLKPAHFRPGPDGTPPPNPPPRRNLDLEIEVLACQNIPLPDEDDKPASFEPYVKIELHVDDPTIEGDEIKSRTKKASNKGTDATWDPKKKTKRLSKLFSSSKAVTEDDGVLGEESHVVEKKSKRIGEVVKFKEVAGVRSPEMCFVRIRVHDEEFGRDDLAAWACVRLDRLKSGWRIVRLFDRRGRASRGVLVVRAGWRLT